MRTLGVVETVQRLDRLRLAVDIERLGRLHLHAIGELEAFDPRGQLRLARMVVEPAAIQAVQERELIALLGIAETLGRRQVVDRRACALSAVP